MGPAQSHKCADHATRFMMQAYVIESFNRTISTSAALQLFRHLKTVLQRDGLKADLSRIYKVHISLCRCRKFTNPAVWQ